MRKIVLFTAMLAISLATLAQPDSLYVYAEIQPGTTVGNRMTVFANYGSMLQSYESGTLRDEAGQRIMFHSLSDAMTAMSIDGWQYVDSYQHGQGVRAKTHFIIRKKIHVSQIKKPNE